MKKTEAIKEAYKVEQKVKHLGKNCTIIESWWDEHSEMRYYVRHSYHLWSVSHSELKAVISRKDKNHGH